MAEVIAKDSWGKRIWNMIGAVLVGPIFGFMGSGATHGYHLPDKSLYGFLLTWAFWLGGTFIAILISVAIMCKSIRNGWPALVAGGLFFGWLMPPMNAQTAPVAAQPQVSQARPAKPLVNVVVERLRDDQKGATVDALLISRLEANYIDKIKEGVAHVSNYDAKRMAEESVLPSTMEVTEQGHTVYVTEIWPTTNGQKTTTAPSMWIIWNIDDNALKRVQCANNGAGWRLDVCGQKIAETFRWSGWLTK